ncbi:MAG: type II toxin-antitoxin system RelE/ParE family toxin [Nitrospirota bacterium]
MKLEWTEPALLDLENLREYIAKDSEYYAARFVARIIDAAETLQELPRIGRVVPEAEDETIRELLFRNYRIMYRVEADRVLILTIIHGNRDISQRMPKPWDVL